MTATAFTPDVEGGTRDPPAAHAIQRCRRQAEGVDRRRRIGVSARAVKLGAAQNAHGAESPTGLRPATVVVTAGANLLQASQKVKTAGAKS
jgi:hypothetical protein